ncbi:MAG: type II secretion system F family protein [Candidatus Omnitrophica bacterium]|nr:type II secretion system F family protein [Candidatus Omnitrophota bacterium]
MAKFIYKAKDGIRTVTGEIETETERSAIAEVEKMGYLPIKVEEVSKYQSVNVSKIKGISSRDINTFTRQLASLIKSKVQLVKALEILSRETQHVKLKDIIADLRDEVRDGRQLSEALGKYPKYFSRIYVNMVASGERGGLLKNILLRLVDFADKEEEIKSKIRAALAYPLLMLAMGALTVFVMITFVMPKLIKLFSDMKQTLPLATRLLISISNFAGKYWYWVILLIGLFIFAFKKLRFIEKKIIPLEKIKLRLPLLGRYILMREIARFCRTLGMLISNGIPIRDAISATVPTLGSKALEEDLKILSKDVTSGVSVAKSLSKIPFFPGFVISLIGVGEEAGRLDEAFLEVAATYERQLDERIKVMSSLIEPVLILSIGLVVGFIVVSMLLPIFQISLR